MKYSIHRIANIFYFFAVFFWCASQFFEAVLLSDRMIIGFDLTTSGILSFLTIFAYHWKGLLWTLCWSSNILFWIGIYCGFKSNLRKAAWFSVVALVLSLTSYFIVDLPLGGDFSSKPVTGFELGHAIWLLSFVFASLPAFLLLRKSIVASK